MPPERKSSIDRVLAERRFVHSAHCVVLVKPPCRLFQHRRDLVRRGRFISDVVDTHIQPELPCRPPHVVHMLRRRRLREHGICSRRRRISR